MINRKTVFVVGAGASCEFKFPLGEELKSKISALVDIRYEEGYRRDSGDQYIDYALREYIQGNDEYNNINSFLHAGWAMRDALPIAISIDNYLEAHQHDFETNLIGKLAIVRAILEAEKASKIAADPLENPPKINFDSVGDVWLKQLVLRMFEGVTNDNRGLIFKNISFISFNYDRCIAHYLLHSLMTYYRVAEERKAADYLKDLPIYHPYGRVGHLPWQNPQKATPFGASESAHILELAENIKTYSERVDDENMLLEMKKALVEAEVVVFLGFAFHNQNMKLLQLAQRSNIKKIFATTFGMSSSEKHVVIQSIKTMFLNSGAVGDKIVMEDMKCHQFIKEYRRSF